MAPIRSRSARTCPSNPFPLDQAGDAVDSSLDAGLDVLRGGTSTSPVTTVGIPPATCPR